MDTSAEVRVALEEASRGVGRGAWATLLVGANAPTYVKHLLCLQKRLREVGSIYPLLVLHDAHVQNVSAFDHAVALASLPTPPKYWRFENTSATNFSPFRPKKRPELMQTWTKLLAWTLTDYKRIALIDGDVWIARNIDWLFDVKLGQHAQVAATSVGSCYYFGLGNFNSGLVLLHPSATTFRAMRAFASNVSNDIGDACEGGQAGDQSFLNAFFRERWMQLPPTVVSHVRFWEISTRRHLPRRVETGRWESFEPGTGRPGPWQAIMPHVADQSKDASEAVCRRLCKPNSGLPLTQKPPARLPGWMSRRWRAYCWCWVPRSNTSDTIDVWHMIGAARGSSSACEMLAPREDVVGDVVGGPVFLPSAGADEFSPILPSADVEERSSISQIRRGVFLTT